MKNCLETGSSLNRPYPTPSPLASTYRGAGRPLLFGRSEEHTSELQSLRHLVCRLLLEKSPAHPDLHSFPTRRSSDLFQHVVPQGDPRRRPRDGVAYLGQMIDEELFGDGVQLEQAISNALPVGQHIPWSGQALAVWQIGRAHV